MICQFGRGVGMRVSVTLAAAIALPMLMAAANPAAAASKPTIDLDARYDTGASSTDNVTRERQFVFHGTADPNAVVTLKSGSVNIVNVRTDAGGSWSQRLIAQRDGVYKLTAVSKGVRSRSLYLVVDRKRPVVENFALEPESDTGISNADGVTAIRAPNFTGKSDESVVLVKLISRASKSVIQQISILPSSELKVNFGPFHFGLFNPSVTISDLAGNESERFSVDVTIDTEPPDEPNLRISSKTDYATGGVMLGRNVAVEGDLSIWTPPSRSANDVDISVVLGDTIVATGRQRGSHWSANLVRPPLGIHATRAVASDVAGNTSASYPRLVKVIRPPRTQMVQALGSGRALRLDGPFGLGTKLAFAGDINGDGIDDLALRSDVGIHGVFGVRSPRSPVSLSHGDPSIGFQVELEEYNSRPYYSLSSAGDVNGDGLNDLAFSSLGEAFSGVETPSYGFVLFGAPQFPPIIKEETLRGARGVTFRASTIAGVGDVDGDGHDDLAMRSGDFKQSAVYILYGPISQQDRIVDPKVNYIGRHTKITGSWTYDPLGQAIAGPTDFNGDGYADLVMSGLSRVSGADQLDGKVTIIFGGSSLPREIRTTSLTKRQGVKIVGFANYPFGSNRLSSGDVDGDGIDDIAASVCTSGSTVGFVVFGRRNGRSRIEVDRLNGKDGFHVAAETASSEECTPNSVEVAGDINGDGLSDLVVGIPLAADRLDGSSPTRGVAYEFLSTKSGYSAVEHVNLVPQFRVRRLESIAGDGFGNDFAAAGDFNGDGADDYILSAPYGESRGTGASGGSAYVIFGKR